MKQPNLLFLYTDEQAARTLAAYGNTSIEMPNLNRLAEESCVFDETYVSQPVCTPSRSTLLTGLWPHTNGCTENNIPLPADIPCLPEMVEKGEYVTGHFGKWHLGDEIFPQHGFAQWRAIEDGYKGHYSEGRDPSARSDYYHFLIENGFTPEGGEKFGRNQAARLPEKYGKPAFLAREASRFLRENRENPFILYVNFLEPHMPFFGPRDDQYDPAHIDLPKNFENVPTEDQHLKARLLHQNYVKTGASGINLETEEGWRRLIANYWGLCSLVDTHAGSILDTLDECGLRDNTIVVYTSDHGDMMGSHQIVAKCLMFEEAVRVPCILRLPGQTDGKRIAGPFSQIDVVPTLLDLMGQPVPERLEGKSVRKTLEGKGNARLDDDVFIEWNGPNNGLGDVRGKVQLPDHLAGIATPEEMTAAGQDPIRTVITPDGWKLNFSPMGEHELYNLKEDAYETTNLYSRSEHADLIDDLTNRIRAWQKQTKDIAPI